MAKFRYIMEFVNRSRVPRVDRAGGRPLRCPPLKTHPGARRGSTVSRLLPTVPALLLAMAAPLRAQTVRVGDPLEDYARVLGIMGLAAPESFLIRPLPAVRLFAGIPDTGHPWATPPTNSPGLRAEVGEMVVTANSEFAWGQNDGALWQGKGFSGLLTGGVGYRAGILDVTVAPALVWAQNSDFALAPPPPPAANSPFAYPYHRDTVGVRIDMPQRFGDGGLARLDPGQTQLRLTWKGVLAAAGTNDQWWGPGIRNAIIMSNNAPGIPHALLGTSRPIDIWIGHLEARLEWGRFTESPYFDTVSTNNGRYFTGLVATLQPAPLPGLTLGGSRVFYQYVPRPFGVDDLLRVFSGVTKQGLATPGNPTGDDSTDQMISLFGRWVLPKSGFEMYAEWARNDHNWDIRDFLLEPEHSQAYTLGFQHARPLSGGRIFRLHGELTHLERSTTAQVRATPPYYQHHLVRQGYTQRGQVVGAGIGPGGDAQYLGGDVFTRWGRVGGWLGRQVHDNDAYYDLVSDTISSGQHFVEVQGGARALVFRGPVTLRAELMIGRQLNRYYLLKNDVTNLHLELGATWRPGRRSPE